MDYEGNYTDCDNYTCNETYRVQENEEVSRLIEYISITVIYALIFVAGVIGSVSTLIVMVRHKQLHTATNRYLCNLVVSDLIILTFGLPIEVQLIWKDDIWQYNSVFCTTRTAIMQSASYASILTVTAFTFERYLAICRPMLCRAMSDKRRAFTVIVAVWIIAVASSSPIWSQYDFYEVDKNGYAIPSICTFRGQYKEYKGALFKLSSIFFFVIPMLTITILYSLIGMSIRRSSADLLRTSSVVFRGRNMTSSTDDKLQVRTSGSSQQSNVNSSVLKLLVAVVVTFFICWAPFHFQRVFSTLFQSITPASDLAVFYTSGILYYLVSVINPILYNGMSTRFRQAFSETFFRSSQGIDLSIRTQ